MDTKQKCDSIFFAGYNYQRDTSGDYWKTAKEFMFDGGGDCEDWAIYWREKLIDLNVPEENIWMTQLPWTPGASHMILLVRDDYNSSTYWIMNVLSYDIVAINIKEMMASQSRYWRRFTSKHCIEYPVGKHADLADPMDIPEWKDCLERMDIVG